MSKGFTKKPCEGCGKSDEWTPRRQGENCDECKVKLKRYNMVEKDLEFLTKDKIYEKIDVSRLSESIYISIGKRNEYNKEVKVVINDIYKLLSLPEEAKGKVNTYSQFYTHEVIEKDVNALLIKLTNTIKTSLIDTYKKGLGDGKNLLFQMNNGDLTLKDFDRH